jgi:hypothetical protein
LSGRSGILWMGGYGFCSTNMTLLNTYSPYVSTQNGAIPHM